MSTYCRITGKSRGLPKPNYFPLLPPISPADAKRLCRITGKSYGLPSHHYIPVLVGFLKDRSGAIKNHCHITAKADGQDAHHYVAGVEHTVLKDYKYVFPKWETSADLTKILEGKTNLVDDDRYVYTVGGEHKCNLVFPGRLEAAVRDGDVSDVMLAKTSDSVLFKLGRSGRSVEVDVEEIAIAEGTSRLYEGEGPSEEALQRQKKRKRAVADKDWRRKIFEDKDQAADDEEEQHQQQEQQRKTNAAVEKSRSSKRMKMKLSAIKESGASAEVSTWKNVSVISAGDAEKKLPIGTGLTTFLSSVGRQMTLEQLTANATSSCSESAFVGADRFTMKQLPRPINVVAAEQSVDLTSSVPGIIQQPNLSPDYCKDHLTGFEIVTVLAPFKPLLTSGFDDDVQHALNAMNENQTELKKMAVSEERFAEVGSLPLPEEIPRVVEEIRKISSNFVDGPDQIIVEKGGLKGVEVSLGGSASDRRFVPGELIETSSSGFVFVPGGTVVASNGRVSFTPGFRVNSNGVASKFIPGQIIQRRGSVDETASDEWVFVAGRTVLTRDGEKFVQGQEVETSEGVKFLPGQTVYTQDRRPAFIPGQIVEDVSGVAGDFKFVPGQIVTSADGPHFVTGIFSAAESHDPTVVTFTPGRTILNEEFDWEFVPGQLMKSADGKSTVFVPGIVSEKDRSFVPGLIADDGDGKRFVPGIVTNDENGKLTFVPGMNINVDERTSKFVEGLIIQTGGGGVDDTDVAKFSFVAGRVSRKAAAADQDGTEEVLSFEPVRTPDQISLRDVVVDVFNGDGNEMLSFPDGKVMFGHMVQSSEGVEFFPGDETVGLPAGKVVPGRLVRLGDKEIQFIPGRMIANKFVPGQTVITDRGEQFIPGQVIETDEGPKFVPGQVLETKTGPKFVPGQTVETAEGPPRFVPGQIVNTKAGPTFIPGQVIHTEEEGSRFVPGQVVDTAEGPRFVPGKVVETGDHVTFIPGQIVQTAEGLKFVAPDLEDDPEGDGFHFTVQGYEVSPEELRMLQRNSISHALFHSFEAEPAINSTMLEQLASAGMAIGREVPIDVPVIDIKPLPITEAACVLGEKLNIDPNYSVKLSHIFSNMQQLLSTTLPLHECDDDNLKILLSALTSTTDGNVLTALSQIMEEIISLEPERKLDTIDLLHVASSALLKKTLESDRGKLSTLHRLLISNSKGRAVVGSENETISALVSILPEEEYAVSSAFKHLCQQNPEMVDNVLQNVAELLRSAADDDNNIVAADGDNKYEDDVVTETIHRAIIKTVMEASERTVREVLDKADSEEFKCLLLDAVGLAKALGMTDIANALVNVLSDAECVQVLAKDNITLDVLKRLTIMRQLAKKRPHLGRALHELQLDPYSARKDPRLKELVRESAALMLVPEESAVVLKSSVDVPASLLFGDNSLAMEDFMVKSRRHGNTFLILKQGLQAVIPREAARSVLTGQVPYTVLDENGIHYFKPLHVFTALKLPQFATNRFSTYSSKQRQNYIDDEHSSDDSGITTKASSSALSYEDLRKSFENGFSITSGQGSGEEFIVVKDYFDDSEDDKPEFYLDKGDRVKVLSTDDDDPTLKSFSEEVNFYKVKPRLLLDNSTARYKITIKPPKRHGDARHRANGACSSDSSSGHPDGLLVQVCDEPSRTGLIPMDYLKKAPASRTNTPDSLGHAQKSKKQEAKFNREVVIGELIETEAEFAQDIQRVVDKYLTPLEQETRPAPRFVMDNKDIIFNNLRQISTFHNGIMVEGVKYFLKEPRTIGKTLLRLERDFDKHAQYCRNEPAAQELLIENEEVRDYFEDLSREIGDDKILSDHLKLPIQRINDYQLLLKELIKYSKILCEDTTDLERALELMLWIPTRCNDLKFVTNIEGFHGNIHKLGRLIRHNWFLVKDKTGGKGRERYCFLFKARLLICKVRRISEDRAVFVLKEIIKLPEVDFKNYPDKRTLVITHSDSDYGNYPFTFIAHEDSVKSDWLNEIAEHITESLALAEHVADDLKLQKEEEDLFEPLKGIELDITADIEEGLDPIETRLHKPLKHVPEPKRPPLEIPKKRVPIFTCVDPEPEPEPEMFSTVQIEEHCSIMSSTQEEMYIETQSTYQEITATESVTLIEEPEVEELIEIPGGKRKPKYIPGVSRPLFHSNIRGTTNERLRSDSKDIAFSWWKYTSEFPSYHEEFESLITAGENAVFECEVEGVSSMTWLKDNRPLSDKLADRINIVSNKENNIYRLEIKNVCETDSGTYTARAENPQGVSLSTAQLIVEKLTEEQKKARAKATTPVFTVQLKDAELLEGTHARFMVKVNGNPAPEVRFFKGDTLITEENENIIINKENADKGFYELIIPDVKPEDAGEYRCEASNKYSDESCSCIVTVTNEKDVFAGLQDAIPAGGAPQFLWLKNGKPFYPEERFKVIFKDEEDSLALVFQNVKPDDAGLYTCIASTSHGKISCSAELTVQGTVKEIEKLPKLAKITTTTKVFEVNAGTTAVLEVNVSGDPLPTVKWKRQKEEIISGGRYKVIFDEENETASLVIKNVNLEDSDEYTVIADNEISADKQTVSLSIKAAPQIKRRLADFVGLTGKQLKFTIEVEASPKPIVQWYKDGMVLKQSKRIKYVTDEASDTYTLIIDEAVMDDAGTYSVVASNEFSQISDVCRVTMKSPPQFVGSITKEIETLEGDYVSFSVMVEGDPLPKPKWKFNGKEIENDGTHVKMSEEGPVYTLLISEVKRTDAGLYSCEIFNQFGSNESEGSLIVKCLPLFTTPLSDIKAKEGDTDIELTVTMNSYPKSTVTWYRDDTDLSTVKKDYKISEDGDNYTLVIKKASTKISGIYKCRAQNEVGVNETSASVLVLTLPNFKKELIDVDVKEGESLKLTVQCRGVPEPEVKWYKDGEELYSDSRIKITRDAKRVENYNLTITLVQSEDGGEYEVRATNEMGTAVTKSLVTVLANTSHKKRNEEETSKNKPTDIAQNGSDLEEDATGQKAVATDDEDSENIISKSTKTTIETTDYSHQNGDISAQMITTKNITHKVETAIIENNDAVNNAIFDHSSKARKNKRIHNDEEKSWWEEKDSNDNNNSTKDIIVSIMHDINHDGKENGTKKQCKGSKWDVTESEITVTTLQTNDSNPDIAEMKKSHKSYTWDAEVDEEFKDTKSSKLAEDEQNFVSTKPPTKKNWTALSEKTTDIPKEELSETIYNVNRHSNVENVSGDNLKVKISSSRKETFSEENVSSTIYKEETHVKHTATIENDSPASPDGFAVFELKDGEFDATASLRPSSFGIIEEPPENEYYIKINVSRGVSIVSVSEEENFSEDDHRVGGSSNKYEETISYSGKQKGRRFSGFSEASEELNLELEEENTVGGKTENDRKVTGKRDDESVISIDIENKKSRLTEIEEVEDDAVNELLKRVQKQRSILGEILEKVETKNSLDGRRNSLSVEQRLPTATDIENSEQNGPVESVDGKHSGRYSSRFSSVDEGLSIDTNRNEISIDKKSFVKTDAEEDSSSKKDKSFDKHDTRKKYSIGEEQEKTTDEESKSISSRRSSYADSTKPTRTTVDKCGEVSTASTSSIKKQSVELQSDDINLKDRNDMESPSSRRPSYADSSRRPSYADSSRRTSYVDSVESKRKTRELEDFALKKDLNDAKSSSPSDNNRKAGNDVEPITNRRRSSYANSIIPERTENSQVPENSTVELKDEKRLSSTDVNRKTENDLERISSRRSSYADAGGKRSSYVDSSRRSSYADSSRRSSYADSIKQKSETYRLPDDSTKKELLKDGKSSPNDDANRTTAPIDDEPVSSRRSSYANTSRRSSYLDSLKPKRSITDDIPEYFHPAVSKDEKLLSSNDVNRKPEKDLEPVSSRRSSYTDSSRRSSYADFVKQKPESYGSPPDDSTKKERLKSSPNDDVDRTAALTDAEPITTNRRSSYANSIKPKRIIGVEIPEDLEDLAATLKDNINRKTANDSERISNSKPLLSSNADSTESKLTTSEGEPSIKEDLELLSKNASRGTVSDAETKPKRQLSDAPSQEDGSPENNSKDTTNRKRLSEENLFDDGEKFSRPGEKQQPLISSKESVDDLHGKPETIEVVRGIVDSKSHDKPKQSNNTMADGASLSVAEENPKSAESIKNIPEQQVDEKIKQESITSPIDRNNSLAESTNEKPEFKKSTTGGLSEIPDAKKPALLSDQKGSFAESTAEKPNSTENVISHSANRKLTDSESLETRSRDGESLLTDSKKPEKENNIQNDGTKESNENDQKTEPVQQRTNKREADDEQQRNAHDLKNRTTSAANVDAASGQNQGQVADDGALLKAKQPVPTATVTNEIERSKASLLPDEDEISRTKEYPRIISGLDNDLSTYETLSVTCDVVGSGVPTPTASWYHEDEELRESKRVHMTQDGNLYKLELLDLRSVDAGTYTIKLENSIGDISKSAQLNISNVENLRGPKLKVPLKDTVINKNQKVIMSATYIADPVPDAIWTVNEKDVNAELTVDVKEIELDLKECQYTMTIPRAELNDTGTYKLKVKNKFETAECSASLTIVMKPEIESFQDIVVTPSTPCKFEVTVKAVPTATVTWTLNNKTLDLNSSNYKLDSEKIDDYSVRHTLTIDDAQLSDQGEYTLTAENNLGTASASANLKLYVEAPSFVKLLEDCAVQDNDLLQMKVRVNGVPKATVTWFKDNKEIVSNDHLRIETFDEGQVSSTLIIDSFTDDDVAEYKVIATNVAGQADSVAKLTMAQIEPSFSEPLKRISDVYEGDTLELLAKVAGSPIPSVQWFKDGELLKPDDEHIKSSTSRDGTIKLFMDDIKTADCGAYKAVATNAIGKSVANTAVVVNQKPKPPSFIKGLTDVTVVEGESVKFQIQISGFPEPKVKWLKDGHPLHACPALDFTSAPNSIYGLTIEKAKLEDAGHYSVIISNKLGEATSSCNTVVTPSDREPFFISKLHPTKVVDGYPVKLEVNVGGYPLPQLSWNFNGKPLPIDGVNIKLVAGPDDGVQCLLIEKVSPSNAGTYKVIATNKLGENFTEAPLTVTSRTNSEAANEKPAFLHGLRDTTVDESSVLSISAPFMGNPIPDVEWYKDGCFLQPDERIHFTCDGYKVGLEIQDTNMGDSGFYSCVLKNPYGEDSSAAHIGIRKLYQAPIFTQRFKHMQQLPGNDCKFHARVTGVPFPSVIWHRNGLPITNSNKFQIKRDGDICCLTIFNVKPEDDAQYSCIASNRDGTATCEAQLQVVDKIDNTPKQEAPIFMKRIGDCELYPGMTAKFTACATGYPEPQYEWFLDTIRLHPSDRYIMEKEPSGLVRLKILEASPDTDTGRYKLRAFNCNGEAFCEAQIIFDTGLDNKSKRPPVGELYKDYDRYRATGAPLPLPDKPIISRMTDRHLTLSWKPSLPFGSREPVTYLVEMEEQPDGEWFTARAGIRSCACDIHNLIPFRDYKFRVRVENTYGISDPSPYAITYREKLQPDPPKIRTHLSPGSTFHPDTSPCFPKDFDIERPPHDNYAQAPRFLRQEYETQYGVKGHNANLFWFVYGYPKPKMAFYFNDELIEMGGRYDSSYTRNGQATLFINKMLDRDVGIYEAVATNEHGIARQRVQLKIAEYPEFLRRPEETTVQLRKSCRLEARVIGVPYPEIKWYKDWQPLASSSRIQIDQVEPDLCILRITDVIMKDEGLYSISARNIAGSISTSVALHVEEPDSPYSETRRSSLIKPKTKPFDDLYDLGDELGRGTQGAVFHVVERSTGKNFAAKVMHGTGDLKKLMSNELDIMNQLHHRNIIRPYDALITPRSFTLIQELAGGGELLDNLTRKPFITEHEVSTYIRQLLLALESMHEFNFAHLGLTPGDLLISHAGGDELRLTDFGLSRKINSRKLEPLYFGMPEFVAPEVINGEGVNLSADMWSVGIITHLLLTGTSLFKADNDAETLDRIKEGKFSVSTDMSQDARDFIIKLLMMNPNNRLDVKEALNHRWIKSSYTLKSDESSQKINTEPLRNYYNLYKNWYSNSSCETWYRRKPLESAYRHPSRMIYPPGMTFTPAPSPEPSQPKEQYHAGSWRDKLPSKHPIDTDIGVAKSESHYQYGPDTYLLQLRDVDFPVRLREYMKVAKVTHENIDWRAPIIRERRKFMDVMDEEIDDEQKARLNQYGNAADIYTLRRLKQEVGTRPVAHLEAEAILGSRIDGQAPFFREKPQFMSVEIDKPADLVCFAVGSPKPVVQWFKNDLVVTEGQRIKYLQDNDGRSVLRLDPVSEFDLGIYKVVARNKFGQTVARTRLVLASEPCAPSAPKITAYSDTEVLLKWDYPKDDGNSPVLCYCLQMKEDVYGEWTTIADNIDHEFWLVHDLRPNIKYQFRLSVMNRIGWSPEGLPSEFVKTKLPGICKVEIPENMKTKQAVSEQGREIIGEEPKRYFDYSREYKPIQWLDEPDEGKYKYISELSRGQFSSVVKALDTESGSFVAAKLLETKGELMKKVNNEFEILRVLCHERIVYLIEGFKCQYSAVAVFIMEKLQGADVITYLTSRPNYTEQMIATIINQVLDGLHYLHWRGYCHLNLQPNNIIMATPHNLQIKLIDFGCARHVNKLGTIVHTDGPLEYTAPEILCEEPAYPNSDIWSVGVITYILLSSVSPFRGNSDLETRQNITFVRYRFEHLYKNLSQEATRFIMLLFKRTPSKRPSAEECQEHRWLLPTEYMIKKREKNTFGSNRLKCFSDDYHSKISQNVNASKEIVSVTGSNIQRSNSIVEELGVF